MRASLAEYLELVGAGFPPGAVSSTGLIPEASFAEACRLTRRFPGALAFSPFGFECRLGSSRPGADFTISLTTNNSGPDILAGNLPDSDFDPELFRHPEWERIRDFGKLWASPPSRLFEGIDEVCVGFDVSTTDAPAALPNFSFSPFGPARDVDANRQFAAEDVVEILESTYGCIQGRGPASSMVQQWERCVRNLPSFDSLFHIALMTSRAYSDTLRLGVVFPTAGSLMRYLEAIDWPGDTANVRGVLERVGQIFGSLRLLFDVSDSVLPRIGVECVFEQRANPDRQPLWSDFMAFLVDNGMCHPGKKDPLFFFTGASKNDLDAVPLPLREMSEPIALKYSSYFIRKIYHTKLVYGEDLAWKAKAYLGIVHAWKSCWGDILTGRGPWGIIG